MESVDRMFACRPAVRKTYRWTPRAPGMLGACLRSFQLRMAGILALHKMNL